MLQGTPGLLCGTMGYYGGTWVLEGNSGVPSGTKWDLGVHKDTRGGTRGVLQEHHSGTRGVLYGDTVRYSRGTQGVLEGY